MHKTAVALRHVAFEDLGLIEPLLAGAGWSVTYRDAATDDLSGLGDADLLAVLGGPIGAYEGDVYPFLADETALIEARLRSGKPILGICLGAQLMAQALGARVYFGGKKEIGWGRVTLSDEGKRSTLAPLSAPDSAVLHWHGDTFDLPDGATRLASNENYPNQAFGIGAHALALQFHIEADPAKLECWFVGHACELSSNHIDIPALRAETLKRKAVTERQAKDVFTRWLDAMMKGLPR